MKNYFFTIGFSLALVMIVGFVFSMGAPVAHAAFNNEINYQGRLTNSSGVAVPNGNYNVQFNLYTVPTGGTSIWTETDCYSPNSGVTCNGSGNDQRVTVNNGLFSVMLGSTTPLTGVNFNQTLYLGVNIGGLATTPVYDGEMTPRKILGAVPAAMYAGTSTAALTAATLNGISNTQFFRDDATNSTSSASTSLSVTQLGSGKVAEFFGSSSMSVLSILSNGNVGIGSSTPGSLLTAIGNVYFGGNMTVTGTSVISGTSTLATTTISSLSVGTLSGLLFGTNGVVTAISTSSLGIPNYFTNSSATTSLSTGTILNAPTGTFGIINATSTTGTSTFANAAIFNGNVGIGSSTPAAKFVVSGNSASGDFQVTNTGTSTSISVASLLSPNATGDTYFSVGKSLSNGNAALIGMSITGNPSGYSFLVPYGQPANTFAVTSIDNVGLSTSTPGSMLTIQGKTGSSTPLLTLASSTGAVSMTVLANGNVGIGTTTPGSLLTVAGNGYFTGVLTSASTTGTSTFANAATFGGNVGIGANATGTPLLISGVSGVDSQDVLTIQGRSDLPNSIQFFPRLAGGGSLGSSKILFTANGGNPVVYFAGGASYNFDNPLTSLMASGETHLYSGTYFDPAGGTAASVKISGNAGASGPVTAFSSGVNGTAAANYNTYGGYFNNSSAVSGTGINYGIYSIGINDYFSGNVGIGTTSPGSKLSISGSDSTGNGLLNINNTVSASYVSSIAVNTPNLTAGQAASLTIGQSASTGNSAGFNFLYQGNNNANNAINYTFFGGSPLLTILKGGNVGIGTTTPGSLLSIQGISGSSTALFTVASSTGAVSMTVLANRNVGIGTSSPSTTLDVGGNITDESVQSCNGSGQAVGTNASGQLVCVAGLSDERLKNNITSLDGQDALNLINSLNPVSFYWKDPSIPGTNSTQEQFGFIAQQVDQVAPNLVGTTSPTYLTPDQTYYLNYQGIIAPLVKAVQQQELQISNASSTLSSTTITTDETAVTLTSLSARVDALITATNASTTNLTNGLAALSSTTASTAAGLQTQINSLASSSLQTGVALAASSTFIQTIASAVEGIIQSAGNWVVNKLSASIVITNDIQTQTIETQSLTTQTASISDGLQMTDQATGYIYCVRLVDGNFAKTLGTCSTTASSTPTPMSTSVESSSNTGVTTSVVTQSPAAAVSASAAVSTTSSDSSIGSSTTVISLDSSTIDSSGATSTISASTSSSSSASTLPSVEPVIATSTIVVTGTTITTTTIDSSGPASSTATAQPAVASVPVTPIVSPDSDDSASGTTIGQ